MHGVSTRMEAVKFCRRRAFSHAAVLAAFLVSALAFCLSAWADDAYVESLGTSFMNAQHFVSPQTKVEVDFAIIDPSPTYQRIVSEGYDNQSVNTLAFGMDGLRNMTFFYGTEQVRAATGVSVDTKRHRAVMDFPNRTFGYYTGTTLESEFAIDGRMMETNVTETSTFPLGLFSDISNADGTQDKNWTRAHVRIYGCKIWEGGTLVHDYRPCLFDGVAGFRDEVSGIFICGKDPAAFVGGGDIRTWEPAYVESLGTSCMNTRHLATAHTKIEVDFSYLDLETKYQRIIGAGSGYETTDNSQLGIGLRGNLVVSFWYGNTTKASTSSGCTVDQYRHTASIDLPGNKLRYCRGGVPTTVQGLAAELDDVTATVPLALFSDMNNASGVADVTWTRAKARIYRCCIWESGVLVHEFRPCVKGGVVGFRDRVDGSFICGEDAAAFTAGGDIEEIADDAYVSTPYNNDKEGLCGIDTGYKVGPSTKAVLDFALLGNAADYSNWWYLLDARGGGKPFTVYSHGSFDAFYYALGGNSDDQWKNSGFSTATGKNVRRQVALDSYNKCVVISTGGHTNKVIDVKASVNASQSSDKTLKIGTHQENKERSAALKVYGLKIYEADELIYDYVPYVKDGVPGLYDQAKDSFITAMATSGADSMNTHCQLLAGGNIEGLVQDAYLESDGTGVIKTDYCVGPNTKIVTDYMLLTTNAGASVIGYEHGDPTMHVSIDGQVAGVRLGSYDWKPTAAYVNFYRHTTTMDATEYSHAGGGWNLVDTTGTMIAGTADGPLGLFGCGLNAEWSSVGNLCRSRIYSVKIYEGDELVHQFLPYKSGATVGFKDTVTGDVLTDLNGSATAFSIGGAGVDGSGRTFAQSLADVDVPVEEVKALSVYAPGAVSYVWTIDGEVQPSTTDTLQVSWQVRPKTRQVTCTPVFLMDGSRVKGAPVAATLKNLPKGFMLLLR